jgi:hypothetical protein
MEAMHVVIYTLGRKFPRLIGKFPNGKPIPFGPFTYVQAGVLVGGVAALAMIVQIFDPPKIPTLVLGAAVIVPAAAAARRIGFSMARTSSRLIWVTRPWLRRAPISTGGRRPTRAQRRLTHTGSDRKIYEAD